MLSRPKLNLVRSASRASRDSDQIRQELSRKNDFIDEPVQFDNELTRQAYKDELAEFTHDLEVMTLAECLKKYEYSIEDALKLDPDEQKRIIIKVSFEEET